MYYLLLQTALILLMTITDQGNNLGFLIFSLLTKILLQYTYYKYIIYTFKYLNIKIQKKKNY